MNITIVGLGVIGGSFAMALNELNEHKIFAIDTNEETIKYAKENNLIEDGCVDGSHILKNSDLVIFSIYPRDIVGFIEKNKDNFKKGAILTDATGIKTNIVDKILSIIPDDVDFVFGHPMAGREHRGIMYASSSVFKGANYLITPHEGNKEENVEFLEKLVLDIGFKRVRKVSPEKHDEIISFTSQLPHALAVALINSDSEEFDTGAYIGDSYRDLTRIAFINEALWSELFLDNKENLLKMINNFQVQLDKISTCLNDDDTDGLIELFKESSKRRQKL